MTSNSYLVTAELTIDLEQDAFDEPSTPTRPSSGEQKLFSRLICKPITLDKLSFNIPDSILINHLTKEAVSVLEEHLNIDHVGTMNNWEAIASDLGMTGDNIMALISTGRTVGMLQKCSLLPLSKLIKALNSIYRVDTLYSLHLLNDGMKLYRGAATVFPVPSTPPASYSQQSTAKIHSEGEYPSIESDGLLVVSYSMNKKEKKDVKWLVNNINNLNSAGKKIYMLEDVVSDANVEESAKNAFDKAEQIIFCLTPSFIDIIVDKGINSGSVSARSVLHVAMLADQEFIYNKCKNFRFRAVLFEDNPTDIRPICWAKATVQYNFPRMAESLFDKLGISKRLQ